MKDDLTPLARLALVMVTLVSAPLGWVGWEWTKDERVSVLETDGLSKESRLLQRLLSALEKHISRQLLLEK